MAHGFICPRLLSLSWDTNTHNEHIYFQFDVQNGRGLHEGSHFHYRNQKHKHSEIHPKCPWSQGVLITQRQTLRPPKSSHRRNPHQPHPGLSPATRWREPTEVPPQWRCCPSRLPPQQRPAALFGPDGWGANLLLGPRYASLSDLNIFLRSLSHRFYFCKLELVLSRNVFAWVL